MKKIIVVVLTAVIVFSFTACGATENKMETEPSTTVEGIVTKNTSSDSSNTDMDASAFEGTWVNTDSPRCTMVITAKDNQISAELNWSVSNFEYNIWTFSGIYKSVDGSKTKLINYTDCKMVDRVYSDENNFTDEVKYENGAGGIQISENGGLIWEDEQYPESADITFEKCE